MSFRLGCASRREASRLGQHKVARLPVGKIDRREFGLTWNQALEAGGFVVGDEIRISVDAEFTAQAGEVSAAA